MPQQVEIMGQGVVEFPDEMSPDDIKNVLRTKPPQFPSAAPATQEITPQTPSLGEIAQHAGTAAIETAKGLIPKSLGEALGFVTPVVGAVEDIGRAGGMLGDVLFGKPIEQATAESFPETQVIPQAEQTAPYSTERFQAGFDTLAQFGMAALGVKGLSKTLEVPKTEEVIPNASEITSSESVTQPEVRPRVGEEAPLRQQGETPTAQEVVPVETQEVAPSTFMDRAREELPKPEGWTQDRYDTFIKQRAGALEDAANRESEFRRLNPEVTEPVPQPEQPAEAGSGPVSKPEQPPLEQAVRSGGTNNPRYVVLSNGVERQVAPFNPVTPEGDIALANGNTVSRDVVSQVLDENKNKIHQRSLVSSDTGTQPVSTVPEAAATAQPEPISTKNAYTEAQREIRGLPEAEQAAKRGFGKVWDEAASEAEKDSGIGRRLVDEINAKPRPISDVENAHLLRHEIEIQKEHSDAIDAVNSAKTDADLTAAKSRLELARTDLQNVYDATKSAGTKGGQALAARKMLANEDYSLAKMEARRRAANDGQPLNENQLSETKALHDKISDLQSKLDAHEVAATFEKEFSKLVDESRKEAKVAKSSGTKFTDFLDRKADEARARITERRGRLTTGFDPTSITDEAVIGASHIAKGLTKFADWSTEMVREFGDQIRPFLKDLWERAKLFHDANAKEYGDKALVRYKTYLGKQTEQIKSKLEAGDFTKAQRQKTQLDKEAFEMRANLQKLKNEFERGVAKEAYRNKTPAQKFWDHFVGVERAMKLSGPEVFGKLGVAAAVREVLAPIESAGGYGVSKVFTKLATGTRYGADLATTVRAELKAKAALFTDGMKDAWQNVKGKETGLEAIGGGKTRPDFWYNRIGQMHAAIKAPVKRAEFARSLEKGMAEAVKNGEDINHPEVMTRIANESVMDANRAIFQNKTVVSGFFSMLERSSPAAGRVARFLFPVVKIPVNLFKELVNLHVGAPVGAARIGMAYWKGVETLPALQREAIIRQLVKGSVGGAGLLWGYYNSDKVRNFFDHAPTWFNHTPMAMVLNEGSYLKQMESEGEQAKQGRKGLAHMAKTDIPFMYTIKDIGDALDTHNSHALLSWINNMTQSTVVPQISTQVAKQMDKPGTFPSNIGERPTFRPAANPIEAVKAGIPGLRQAVSEKEAKPKGGGTRSRTVYGY